LWQAEFFERAADGLSRREAMFGFLALGSHLTPFARTPSLCMRIARGSPLIRHTLCRAESRPTER
jgi:hypothetical protein